MIEIKNVEKIKTYRAAADKLRKTYPYYMKCIEDSRCDKHALSFKKQDSRFTAWKADISLTAYTGYYGNSSCSTFGCIDSKLAEEAINAFLDTRMKELLAWMADYVDAKANGFADEARKEIAQLQELIENAQPEVADGAE